jgi:O-antigen/teichoic acid export membrane protein
MASALLQIASFIILARAIGIEAFATIILITAANTLGASFCGIGCGDTITRRVARDSQAYPAMLGHSLILVGTSGFVLVLASTVALQLFFGSTASFVNVNTSTLLLFAIANIPLSTLITLTERMFIGRQQFFRANLANVLYSAVRFSTVACAYAFFGLRSLEAWAIWTFAAHLAASTVCLCLLRSFGRPVWKVDGDELRLGLHSSTSSAIEAFRQNVDRITLAAVVAPSTLASYGTAIRLTHALNGFVTALNRILYPKFSSMIHSGLGSALRPALVWSMATGVVSLFGSAAVFLIAPWLPILLGAEYQPVILDLRLLCWLLIPLALQTIPYELFGAFDRHPIRAAIYNRLAIIGTICAAIAVYSYGITAAYLAMYIIEVIVTIALWWAFVSSVRREATSKECSPASGCDSLASASSIVANT